MIKYEEEVKKVLKRSEKEANLLHHPFVGTEHFLLGVLSTQNEIKNKLNNFNITYDLFKSLVKKTTSIHNNTNNTIYTPLLKRIISNSIQNNEINLKNIFMTFLEEGEGIGISLLTKYNIDLNKLYKSIKTMDETNTIGINLNEKMKDENLNLVGRENELNKIIEVLCKKEKCNPLLIGNAGVGKTALVEYLAKKINEKSVPNIIENKKVISISLSKIVSGTKYRGEFEEKLNNVIKEFENNDNYILFIDEIHTLIGAGGAEGAIDASNILKPYLSRDKIKCIGATTITEYNKTIKKDKALDRRFTKIYLNKPGIEDTKKILKSVKKEYELHHNVRINDKEINLITELSEKYIKDKYEPDRSLDILDEVCSKINLSNKKNDIIKELEKKKYIFVKSNNFKQVINIENKINKAKNNKPLINKKDIYEIFNIKSNKISIGFKNE